MGAKFTHRGKLHPWGSTNVVKSWPQKRITEMVIDTEKQQI
jgi:hypothetical protein